MQFRALRTTVPQERYLQVVVLPLLLCLEVESSETSQVLLAHSLIHSGSTPDSLTVVVSRVGPPVSFGLHVAEDHVLDRGWKSWNLK